MPNSEPELCCCEKGSYHVVYRKADFCNGPEENGFAVVTDCSEGEYEYCNISFCPWCGRPVPDTPKNCRTKDEDREVEVHITFDTSRMSKEQRKLLSDITCALGNLGVTFDTGGCKGEYDWEWDWSLHGPVKVLFRCFTKNNPKNRYSREHEELDVAKRATTVRELAHVIEGLPEEEN